jgi:predicted ATPase
MSAAHGGQVVLSQETVELLDGSVELEDLGQHRFKDIGGAERVYQLGRSEHPPLRSLYRIDLPVPTTPFLGRERELADVVERLTDADTRILTLLGPGGTGKTRLAIEAASAARAAFVDGITWVPLAPLREPALALPAIARELRLTEQPGEPVLDTVTRALLGKQALILLDNAEHLLPDLARDVAVLAAACPTLRLLVTSRERLQLGGEAVWQVPTLGEADATVLFTERARAVARDFAPDEVVSAICARLDQLPLAIELAAARTRTLSAGAILERLEQRLPLLTSRAHDVDERQRTLAATIDWSYDLLAGDEQRALRALSIFAGGWPLEAAEHVAGADLDLLESLLDKSLVRRRVEMDGSDRYWMLETIREYAFGKLSAESEERPARDAHLAWAAEFVDTHAPRLGKSAPPESLVMILGEEDNIREALTWAAASGSTAVALKLVGDLSRAIVEGALWTRFSRLVDAVLAMEDAEPHAHAVALLAAAIGRSISDQDTALRQFVDAEQALRRLGMTREAAFAAGLRAGLAAKSGGDLTRAIDDTTSATSDLEALGDADGARIMRGNLVELLARKLPRSTADVEHLIELNRQLIEADRAAGDLFDEAIGHGQVACLLSTLDRHGEAVESVAESLRLMGRVQARRDFQRALMPVLVRGAIDAGRHRDGLVLCGAMRAVERDLGGTVATPEERAGFADLERACRAELPGPIAESLFSRGAAMTTEQVIELCLEFATSLRPGDLDQAPDTP